MSEQLYYIQRVGDYAYDYILWWSPNRNGYTYNLDKAGKYTREEASSICGIRGEEVAWPVEAVEQSAERAVEIGKLRKAVTSDQRIGKKREIV